MPTPHFTVDVGKTPEALPCGPASRLCQETWQGRVGSETLVPTEDEVFHLLLIR